MNGDGNNQDLMYVPVKTSDLNFEAVYCNCKWRSAAPHLLLHNRLLHYRQVHQQQPLPERSVADNTLKVVAVMPGATI